MERSILVERKVRAHPVVVGRVIRQQMTEVPFRPSKNSKYSAAHKSNKLVDPRAVAWLPAVPLRKGSVVFDVFLALIRRRKASALPNHLGYQTLTPLRLNAVSGHSEYGPVPEPYGIVAHPALLRAETQDKLMARLAVDAHPANQIKTHRSLCAEPPLRVQRALAYPDKTKRRLGRVATKVVNAGRFGHYVTPSLPIYSPAGHFQDKPDCYET